MLSRTLFREGGFTARSRLIDSNGVQIALETRGRGPDLIYAHGLSSNRRVTLRQFKSLTHRYRVIAFDQRGHGESSAVRNPALYSLASMAADIARVMDELGIRSAIVGGESMGAATALQFALSSPQRVKALLLTSPAIGDTPHSNPEIVRGMAMALESLGRSGYLRAVARQMKQEGLMPGRAIRYVVRFQSVHDAASLALACRTVIQWVMPEQLSRLDTIPFPVCILGWPKDLLHPLSLAERMAAVIPNAKLVRLSSVVETFLDPPSVGRRFSAFLTDAGL